MGVQGLLSFMNRNDYFKIHQLKDTVLVIDGYNLVYQQFFKYQQNVNDHMYGGDYDQLARHVQQFFKSLLKCNIQPIVVFDGAIDPSLEKLKTLLKRVDIALNNAHKIYANNYFIEGVMPLLADSIYRLQLERLGIPVFQTCYEADQTIIQIAYDLECPILSNDSDFLLFNLPAGIVNLQSLFDFDVVVNRDSDDHYYIRCRYYCVENLKRPYPKINLDLVQIIGFMLGNDYVDNETMAMFTRRISSHKDRQKLINDVFIWIAKHDTLKSLIGHMGVILRNTDHHLIEIIKKHYLLLERSIHTQKPIDHRTYLEENISRLFIENINIPRWMRSKFVHKQIHCRLLSIINARIDWCRPLVEDFSYPQSSYETANELLQCIYGILRSQDKNTAKIKRYCRKNMEFKAHAITPIINMEKKLLPKLSAIEQMDSQERKSLFFQILQIKPEVYESLMKLLDRLKTCCSIDHSTIIIPFSSMLLALLYMLRNFPDHIWLEFVYAIFMNIWFTGYLCHGTNGPIFLKLDSISRQTIQNNLIQFSSLPVLSCSKVYMPRLVHFYNSFQTCVDNIDFLGQIFNLKHIFNADIMLCALKGTFIYNLTAELCSRPKPFLYIQQLLQRQKFKPLDILIEMFNLILHESDRYMLAKNRLLADSDIVTKSLKCKITNTITPNNKYFVRAFDFTSKKTHVNSQKLKLHK
ncbi:Protein asteroid 1 [Dermatophagoides farinae]|uniref:Protein asteroid 1 n=1 Tax=Dermatophagoides farinae TaxID=6954 RepID=A0A922LCD3_DERFA|nr:protein asteroid homolog 1-like [Dermatophagoides farinae]KAH7642063.1 xpg and nyn domain containing protein [Dermatophagoides farinae]KAH9529197.1 Protein asteroid 1 [Dermatophagoides farinae]